MGLVWGLVLTSVAGAAAAPATLTVVGQNTLGGRGMNAALAVADHCAYVGSRNEAGALVVDIANPASPRVSGQLAAHRGSTPRELRTVASLHQLAVMYYSLNGGRNLLDIYWWTADCLTPTLVGTYDFGGASPHEFYLWQDPQRPSRVLLYVATFASSPALVVLDISDASKPVRAGGWSVPSGYGTAKLHSIALSPDGRTAYLSLWLGGLAVADSSDFVTGAAEPALRLLTPAAGVFRTPPGDVHSAVPVPGKALLVTTDERYPAPYGQGCPYGPAHVVDVSNRAHPLALATLLIPENDPSECAAARRATWTSHNPTLTANLALINWYSGGLEVFGLDDPAHPQRLAEFRPGGINPALRDVQLGTTDAMTWSYPVIYRGLVYVVDINQGLVVLRYAGLHEGEISGLSFAEGNSNLTSAGTVAATASPAGSAKPSASASPRPAPSTGAGFTRQQGLIAVGVVALAAIGIVIVALRRRDRGAR